MNPMFAISEKSRQKFISKEFIKKNAIHAFQEINKLNIAVHGLQMMKSIDCVFENT